MNMKEMPHPIEVPGAKAGQSEFHFGMRLGAAYGANKSYATFSSETLGVMPRAKQTSRVSSGRFSV